ncbi:hypothetical protein RND71_025127 [Anisodus tanguticus]|uniref:Uncharacterized protein n=1 Tax=Anisodus tanguticus TaxID=243964 RepID=A0AAE1VA42_9SOLA|nr:hypothetical protein RND71_025127 [Anisodus tanguticus]
MTTSGLSGMSIREKSLVLEGSSGFGGPMMSMTLKTKNLGLMVLELWRVPLVLPGLSRFSRMNSDAEWLTMTGMLLNEKGGG